MDYQPPLLPLGADLETKTVLKKLAGAHRALAELKGGAGLVPNQAILIDTLSLQEAKDSSAIENIITTHDDLYRSDAMARQFASLAAKEVHSYAKALREGFACVKRTGLITSNDIIMMQGTLEENDAGFRKLPGTNLKNDNTGEVVYTPPQNHKDIVALMRNLEEFINDNELSDLDPLIKMAVIHHQFESIHPFYDGNGRTGRIINILYLVKEDLLSVPILYLSRYINQNKGEYYRLLQEVRSNGSWEEWIVWMLSGVEATAAQANEVVGQMKRLMQDAKNKMRKELPRIYSQELLNNLFRHPYTKIDFVMKDLHVHRNSAMKYLNQLSDKGFVTKIKMGRENYYLNRPLFNLLRGAGAQE
ncbi:MAG: Fic family protein [Allosphingosinicella sp.]